MAFKVTNDAVTDAYAKIIGCGANFAMGVGDFTFYLYATKEAADSASAPIADPFRAVLPAQAQEEQRDEFDNLIEPAIPAFSSFVAANAEAYDRIKAALAALSPHTLKVKVLGQSQELDDIAIDNDGIMTVKTTDPEDKSKESEFHGSIRTLACHFYDGCGCDVLFFRTKEAARGRDQASVNGIKGRIQLGKAAIFDEDGQLIAPSFADFLAGDAADAFEALRTSSYVTCKPLLEAKVFSSVKDAL